MPCYILSVHDITSLYPDHGHIYCTAVSAIWHIAPSNNVATDILYNITLCNADPKSPPNNLHISVVDFSSKEFTFNWSSPVAAVCPLHYNILSSNCGSCPTTTTNTTVTCTDVPTDSRVCTFAVETVVCGNITGNSSDPIILATVLMTDHSKVQEGEYDHTCPLFNCEPELW